MMWTRSVALCLVLALGGAAEPEGAFIPDEMWEPSAPPISRGEPADVGSAAGRMAGALVLVLVCAGAAFWGLRAFLRRVGTPAGGRGRRLRLLETLPLGQRRSLALVQIDGRVLVVGSGEGGVCHVATLDDAPAAPAGEAVPTPASGERPAAGELSAAAPAGESPLSRFETNLRRILGGGGR